MAEVTKLDKNSALDRQLTQLWEQAKNMRGLFLEQAISIEYLVVDIVSWHFCPEEDKRNLFFSLIINNPDFTFSSKIEIFKKLLKLCYPDLSEKYPRIIDEADKIRRFRNRIAHAMLDNSDEFLAKKYTDRIQLVYYQDGKKKQQVVTGAQMKTRLRNCSRLVLALVDIQKEVIGRVSANTD